MTPFFGINNDGFLEGMGEHYMAIDLELRS